MGMAWELGLKDLNDYYEIPGTWMTVTRRFGCIAGPPSPLRSTFGYASIYVSLLPYCMIHFGKPLPEVLAALVAGLVLGHLSLASRSIWPGVALHIFAAATMDLAVLWRKGLLG